MATSTRYRRCPRCAEVRPASVFRRAGGPTGGPTFASSQAQWRECPACGFADALVSFTRVEWPQLDQDEQP
jgi:hypothetical protein